MPPPGAFNTKVEKRAENDAAFDLLLTEAIQIAKATMRDSPLLAKVLYDLTAKERRRMSQSAADLLTVEALRNRGNTRNRRECQLAQVAAEVLGEPPIRESVLPGFGQKRVDMLFPGHRLVIEENGRRHRYEEGIEARDALLREVCKENHLLLLEFGEREPITREHVEKRLRGLGVRLP